MRPLSEQLLELLGKREDAPEFQELLAELGEASRISELGQDREYGFASHGFGLNYDIEQEAFWLITFEFGTDSAKSGAIKPFIGLLPMGLTQTDLKADIEQKLGIQPVRQQKISKRFQRVIFKVPPHRFDCIFDSTAFSGLAIHLLSVRDSFAGE